MTGRPSYEDIAAVLRQAADFIKDRDEGEPSNETGWASDEGLDIWISLNCLLSRLEAGGGAETGWQPIETAPKMKTVLLFAVTEPGGNNWRLGSGFWHTGYESDQDRIPWCWEGHQLRPWEVIPTHWMPLPPPPLNQEGGDAAEPRVLPTGGARPHVAPPASGASDPGRVEASGAELIEVLLDEFHDYESSDLPYNNAERQRLRDKYRQAKQALLDHIVHMHEAGRRSGLEEAATSVRDIRALIPPVKP